MSTPRFQPRAASLDEPSGGPGVDEEGQSGVPRARSGSRVDGPLNRRLHHTHADGTWSRRRIQA